MSFAKFTLLELIHPKPHEKKIYVNLDRIIWLRPYDYSRLLRDDKGNALPYANGSRQVENIPVVALGFGAASEHDSGEIIVVDPLGLILQLFEKEQLLGRWS